MSKPSAPLIHIGYVKTGSTWLQRQLFDSPTNGYSYLLHRQEIGEQMIRPFDCEYDCSNLRSLISLRSKEIEGAKKTAVISHERLSGDPISGGYDNFNLSRRLKELIPEAHILIVIREQLSAIYSYYFEYINGGGANSLNRFLNPKPSDRLPQFNPVCFEYDKIISYYQGLYGKDFVHVLLFEDLKTDPNKFVGKINSICGNTYLTTLKPAEVRKALKPTTVLLLRRVNFGFSRGPSNPNAPFDIVNSKKTGKLLNRFTIPPMNNFLSVRDKKLIREKFSNYYKLSNRNTESLTNLSLKGYNYSI